MYVHRTTICSFVVLELENVHHKLPAVTRRHFAAVVLTIIIVLLLN